MNVEGACVHEAGSPHLDLVPVSHFNASQSVLPVGTNRGPLGVAVYALTVSDINLFAGTSGGVFLSSDDGTAWSQVNSGLTAGSFTRARAMMLVK